MSTIPTHPYTLPQFFFCLSFLFFWTFFLLSKFDQKSEDRKFLSLHIMSKSQLVGVVRCTTNGRVSFSKAWTHKSSNMWLIANKSFWLFSHFFPSSPSPFRSIIHSLNSFIWEFSSFLYIFFFRTQKLYFISIPHLRKSKYIEKEKEKESESLVLW